MNTAGSTPPGFVGIHLLTDAPGLPVHEPAVVVTRDPHAARCPTPPAPPRGDRVATASTRASESTETDRSHRRNGRDATVCRACGQTAPSWRSGSPRSAGAT